MCVEVDLQEKVVEGFPLVVGQNQVLQHVRYEKRGLYCNKCFRQGHTAVVCRVGDKSIRNEGLRKEREEKLAVIVEDSEIVLNVSKESENVLNVSKDIVNGQVETGGCAGSKNTNENSEEGYSRGEMVIVEEVKDVEEEVEGVVCRNSFAVLCDGDNDVRIDPQKDYNSNPGGLNFRGISHVPRDANMVQHGLAKLAISTGCDQYWLEEVPSVVGPIVLDDAKLP
ncbi:hypothetical protein Q3G72_012886 [Acer saccharum]|nr:hypothetical protein Q3G72_012886 [Acer saccharum]